MKVFRFKHFSVITSEDVFPINTDSILLGAWADCAGKKKGLDIGTGTGVLAIICNFRHKFDEFVAVDSSSEAAKLAKQNFDSLNLRNFKALHISFREFYTRYNGNFDFIISNPPFFDNQLLAEKQIYKTTKHTTTLSFEDLLKGVSQILDNKGVFATIIPAEAYEKFSFLAGYYGLYLYRKTYVKTTPVKKPSRILLQFSKKIISFVENTITLLENSAPSADYKALTKNLLNQKN